MMRIVSRKISTPQRLANRTHLAKPTLMLHVAEQLLLKSTLRNARICKCAKLAILYQEGPLKSCTCHLDR